MKGVLPYLECKAPQYLLHGLMQHGTERRDPKSADTTMRPRASSAGVFVGDPLGVSAQTCSHYLSRGYTNLRLQAHHPETAIRSW